VNDINANSAPDDPKVSVNDFRYYDENQRSKRGDSTNNDSYLTAQFTVGKVIRGRSNFYKSKYSYLKNRAGVRRSKAKF
jgi:Zn-dependent oligopeptidase